MTLKFKNYYHWVIEDDHEKEELSKWLETSETIYITEEGDIAQPTLVFTRGKSAIRLNLSSDRIEEDHA